MKDFKFVINGNQYSVTINNIEDNIAEIDVNGSSYKVQLQKEIKTSKTPKLVRTALPSKQERKPLTRSGKLTVIKAPLPGNILQVMVHEGDTVKKEQKLMVLEAMKMENLILAETDGVVKRIAAHVGDVVSQDQVLVEIE